MKNIVLFGLVVLFTAASTASAQPEFQFSLQSWGSFTSYEHSDDSTSTQAGFGIRRARIRGKMTQEKAAAFIQYEAINSTIVDVRLDYILNDNLMFRMGRFVGPGSQAGSRTGHTSIDLIERSIVGRNWGTAVGRSDSRTTGLALIGKQNFFGYEIMISNGSNSINLVPYNSKSSNSDIDTGQLPQIDVMGQFKLLNTIKTGIHYGLANEDRVNKSSLTGYAYFRPEEYSAGNMRFKFDFAKVDDLEENNAMMGYSALAVYKATRHFEIGSRIETWDWDIDTGDNVVTNFTIGINYSVNPDQWTDTMFKIDFTLKSTDGNTKIPDPLIIHILWQMYLHN
ncbi:MAG: hypothetical protein HQ528_01330 [Candidatus Marinimicrobia bacterium]|nr:hypothetical protein [Candidatus Neomarinimicrobiota bacterium]